MRTESPLELTAFSPRASGPAPTAARNSRIGLEAAFWRAACEQPSLAGALGQIHGMLVALAAVSSLSLFRFERDTARLVLCAQEPLNGAPSPLSSPELDSEQLSLLNSLPQGQLVALAADSPLGRLLARGADVTRIHATLLEARGHSPRVVALALADGSRLEPSTEQAMAACLDPLRFACERDDDARELSQLRGMNQRAPLASSAKQDVIIGVEGGLREVMERVSLVAPTRAPVLILGETGAGKEVIARALHHRSTCGSGPLVRVNCGAIPPELVDSELFGHERGSFTGAVSSRQGWFERAHGGTLFLDEVGELPLAAQVRLLRVLQDGSLERVGGQRTLHVDVRVVAATHRDVHAMVQAGTFRQDLWYRLSVFPIRLPSLRERSDDIPALASHFVNQAGRRLGVHGLAPTAHDLRLLTAYDWPGNVRELAAVIERATILGKGLRLEVERALGSPRSAATIVEAASIEPVELEANVILPLDQAMSRHIERALLATAGRIEGPFGAAQLLRVNPHTLRARMRKLDIDWARFRPESSFGGRGMRG